MVKFKVVISDPKTGKSLQKEVDSTEVTVFKRKKIGDKIEGKPLGLEGYEFEITGGSDTSGFPMRKDVEGIGRKRVLMVEGVGLRKVKKGTRVRKTVCGNTISLSTAQINLKVIKYGKAKLGPEVKAGESEVEKPKKEGKVEKKETKEEPKEKEKAEETKKEKADVKEKKVIPKEKPKGKKE